MISKLDIPLRNIKAKRPASQYKKLYIKVSYPYCENSDETTISQCSKNKPSPSLIKSQRKNLLTISSRPSRNENINSNRVLNTKAIHRSFNSSQMPTPSIRAHTEAYIEAEESSPSGLSEESLSLFYPQEPRLQLNSDLQRNEASYSINVNRIKKSDGVEKQLFNFKEKWQQLCREHKFEKESLKIPQRALQSNTRRGKVRKGICMYPSRTPSPMIVHNFKLSHY